VIVIPAKAGIQKIQYWIPIFMGMTKWKNPWPAAGQACQENKKLPDSSTSCNPLMKYVG